MNMPRIAAAAAWWCLSLVMLAGCASSPGTLPDTGTPVATTESAAPAMPVPEAAVSAAPEPPAAAEPDLPAPTPAAVDPLRPDVRLDLDDRSAQLDLWSRVRAGFAMPAFDTPLVRDHERWYAARPDYVQRMTERGSRYLFHVVE
jgi:membrane-bound lytic murein transglycosylase D